MFIKSKMTKLGTMVAVTEIPVNHEDEVGIVIDGYNAKFGGSGRQSIAFSIEAIIALKEILNEWEPPADK